VPIAEFRKLLYEKMICSDGQELCPTLPERRLFGRREEAGRDFANALLEPKFAILDETDSGLDIEALRIVSEGVNASPAGTRLYHRSSLSRILNYIKPHFIHVMYDARLSNPAGRSWPSGWSKEGYDKILKPETE